MIFRTVAKTVLPIILVLSVCLVKAEKASYDDVQKVACNFMKRSFGRTDSIVEVVKFDTLGITTMYAINFEKGGYVLVSGSYKADPILAYSEYDKFLPKERIENEGVKEFLGDCNAEIIYREDENLRSTDDEFSAKKWKDWLKNKIYTPVYYSETYIKEVPNLLYDSIIGDAVEWNQKVCYEEILYSNTTENPRGICYNNMMPSVKGRCDHASAGCLPVALAQVMWKWKWPENIKYEYKGEEYTSEYTWDSMPTRLSVFSSTRNMKEISTLLRDCGYMLNVMYDCGPTGGIGEYIYDSLVNKNLIEYNGFGNIFTNEYSKLCENEPSVTYPMAEWLNMVVMDLIAGRPVIVSSIIPPGGHCYVISGFQRQEDGCYFYVNFGWGGSQNGYYNIDFTTDKYMKERKKMALIGFSPKKGNDDHKHDIKAKCVRSTIGNTGHLSFNVKNANSYILKIKYLEKDCENQDDIKEVFLYRRCGNIFKNGDLEVWYGDNIKLKNEYETKCGVFVAPTMYEISFINNYGQVEKFEGVFSEEENTAEENTMANDNISIYPNPTSGNFCIDSHQGNIVRISVSDISGKTIKMVDKIDKNRYDLDLSESPVGCYFVSVLTENSCIVKKIIKE